MVGGSVGLYLVVRSTLCGFAFLALGWRGGVAVMFFLVVGVGFLLSPVSCWRLGGGSRHCVSRVFSSLFWGSRCLPTQDHAPPPPSLLYYIRLSLATMQIIPDVVRRSILNCADGPCPDEFLNACALWRPWLPLKPWLYITPLSRPYEYELCRVD